MKKTAPTATRTATEFATNAEITDITAKRTVPTVMMTRTEFATTATRKAFAATNQRQSQIQGIAIIKQVHYAKAF